MQLIALPAYITNFSFASPDLREIVSLKHKIRKFVCTCLVLMSSTKQCVFFQRQLVNLSTSRFEHLVTQLKWRLAEGGGEALYELGVEDDGRLAGLAPRELSESVGTLQRMAARLGATARVLRERKLPNSRKVVEMLVRRVPEQPEVSSNFLLSQSIN